MMLKAAIDAEVFKLRRNRVAVWWAFWLVPIVLFAFGLLIESLMPTGSPQLRAISAAHPIRQAAASFGHAGNPLIQLFFAIGAAGLFAGEYRWETWRLIAPRNARTHLVLAKFITWLLFASTSLSLIVLGGLAASFYGPLVHGAPILWPDGLAKAAGELGLGFLAAILVLTLVGALAGFGAILTRSMLGGVVPALLLGFAQVIATSQMAAPSRLEWSLLIPQFAASATRVWGQSLGDDPDKALLGVMGALIMAAWIALLVFLAVQAFRRQDLARE